MMQPQQPLTKVNIHEVQEKFQSKKEVYNFLTQECDAYLPKLDTINVYFLKQIVRGQKEYIKRSSVKIAAVPQIEGLTIEDFLHYAKERPELIKFMPEERDWEHLDKKWVCDVLYTKDTQGIQNMINSAMEKRKKKLEQSQHQLVEMRPEFANALKKCIAFSTEKGKSAFLLKGSAAKKRKHSDIEEVKGEETQLQEDKQQFLLGVKKLRQDNSQLQEEIVKLRHFETTLNNLHRQGYVNEEGVPIRKA